MQGVRPNAKLILRCSQCSASCLEPHTETCQHNGNITSYVHKNAHSHLCRWLLGSTLLTLTLLIRTMCKEQVFCVRVSYVPTRPVYVFAMYTCAKGGNSLDEEEKESFECRFFRAIRVTLPVWMCALPDNASIHRCRSDRSKSESPFDVRSRCAMGENYGGMSSRFQMFEHGCMCAYANAWHVRLCS